MKVVWSPRAERSATRALAWIAHDRLGAALAWFANLRRRVAELARFPRRGRVLPELGQDEYRELILQPYRVVYHVGRTRISILAVRHVRQER